VMANDAAIKKSLEFRKYALAEFRKSFVPLELFDWFDEARKAFIEGWLQCELTSLEAAAEFFNLDHNYQPHREILLMVLAHAVFGKHKRGVKKDYASVWWSPERLLALGMRDRELKLKNPKLKNSEVAARICKANNEFKIFRRDSNPVRKRLPYARQLLAFWEITGARRRLDRIRPRIEAEAGFIHEAVKDPRKRKFLEERLKKYLSDDRLLKVLRKPGPMLFDGLLSDLGPLSGE
jgi:hypothetical protein